MTPTKPRKLTPRQKASYADTGLLRLKELAQDSRLARLVAANPNASPDLLLELSHSDDKAVRKACTSNANTPVEALLKLGAQFPEQLLENPVFDLLLLAHPGLFEELPTATLNSLLKRDQVPVGLIRWAWKHRGESTLHSLLMNPNMPADVVEELCKSKDTQVRLEAQLHCTRKLPQWADKNIDESNLISKPELKSMLVIDDSAKEVRFVKSIVELTDTKTSIRCIKCLPDSAREHIGKFTSIGDILKSLASDESIHVRSSVALNKNTPPVVLIELAQDSFAEVRRAVAENKSAPSSSLCHLSKDDDKYVRFKVAKNESASPISLSSLARQSDQLAGFVARNPGTTEELLAQLAVDSSGHVRAFVATNSRIPVDIFFMLMADEDARVRRALCENPRLTPDAQLALASDQDDYVRLSLASRWSNIPLSKEVLSILARDSCRDVRFEVAREPGLPVEVEKVLCNDDDSEIREEIAKNSGSQLVLRLLSSDHDKYVRGFVASSEYTDGKTLASLAGDKEVLVRAAAAGNANTPAAALCKLSDDDTYCHESEKLVSLEVAGNTNAPGELLAILASNNDVTVRCRVASGLQVPIDVLVRLSRDPEWSVRLHSARHKMLPQKDLERLAKDNCDIVRKLACKKLLSLEAKFTNKADDLLETGRNTPCITDELTDNNSVQALVASACTGTTPSPGRRLLFTLPECPANLLAKNFRSRNWLERFAIAGNPSTPEAVLERMANEGNQLVRRAAASNLARRAASDEPQLFSEQSSPSSSKRRTGSGPRVAI